MEKTFALVTDQSDKSERDNVEVVLTKTTTTSEPTTRTAAQMKAEILKQLDYQTIHL